MDLGANRVQTFFKVILPQTLPGILGGAVIVFIPSVGNFIVPDVLGGAKGLMIGNLVEQQFLSARNWPFGVGAVDDHHDGGADGAAGVGRPRERERGVSNA